MMTTRLPVSLRNRPHTTTRNINSSIPFVPATSWLVVPRPPWKHSYVSVSYSYTRWTQQHESISYSNTNDNNNVTQSHTAIHDGHNNMNQSHSVFNCDTNTRFVTIQGAWFNQVVVASIIFVERTPFGVGNLRWLLMARKLLWRPWLAGTGTSSSTYVAACRWWPLIFVYSPRSTRTYGS